MRFDLKRAADICRLLVKGMSVRSIERFTGVHRDTILRLLVLVGEKCERIMAEKVSNVSATYVQCDEVWAYADASNGSPLPR